MSDTAPELLVAILKRGVTRAEFDSVADEAGVATDNAIVIEDLSAFEWINRSE